MKTIILTLLTTFCIFSQMQSKVIVKVSNPCNFDRKNELVELSIAAISKKISLNDSQTFLVEDESGTVIPSQLTYDNKLIFSCDLKAKASTRFTIIAGNPRHYAPQVFGAYLPQRKDDFVWENDRVGFRFYGDSLKYSDGPSNGMDLWYKRTSAMVLQKWYENALKKGIWFHTDRGEGCDAYAVGRSLGAGAMAPCIDGNLILNDNFLKPEILDDGPLRFTARLIYPDFQVNGNSILESRTVSLDAGSQLTAITENYGDCHFPVAAGIVKRLNEDSTVVDLKSNYFIYAEPKTKENGAVFLGVYLPNGLKSVYTASYSTENPVNHQVSKFTHTLGISQYQSRPFTYYTGFGWEKFGFPSIRSFEEYMKRFVRQKEHPLKVKYL